MRRAIRCVLLTWLAGCDVGLRALEFECKEDEAPKAEGGCQSVGVPAVSVLVPPPSDCDELALPGGRCAPIACEAPDAEDPRFAHVPINLESTIPDCCPGFDQLPRIHADARVGRRDAADGTKERPFATLTEAIAAADERTTTVIVAARGTFHENLVIDRNVAFWGACADATTLEAADLVRPTIAVEPGLSQAGIGGMTVRGGAIAVDVVGSTFALLHVDVRAHGIALRAQSQSKVWLWDARVSGTGGVKVYGSTAHGKDIAIRAEGDWAIEAFEDILTLGLSEVFVESSLIEHGDGGVRARDSHLGISGSWIRGVGDTFAGVSIDGGRLVLNGSVVERGHGAGVEATAGKVEIMNSVIRDTHGDARGCGGQGIRATSSSDQQVEVRFSLVEGNAAAGILTHGASLTVQGVLIRDTGSEACTGSFGDGLAVYDNAATTVRATRIEASTRASFGVFGSLVSITESALGCSAAPVTAQTFAGTDAAVVDQGAAVCGCDAWGPCRPADRQLEPWMASP